MVGYPHNHIHESHSLVKVIGQFYHFLYTKHFSYPHFVGLEYHCAFLFQSVHLNHQPTYSHQQTQLLQVTLVEIDPQVRITYSIVLFLDPNLKGTIKAC